ncbi:phosphate ABC transporter substrate-binding protein PstS [Streptomyces piniterrae]|uniref:Phosphate-binding protein n=1 Tax=Streptomyces piniterrae TaxID=2571125 RepID=A0A4U0N4P0_9ACTN|nr:phosphate ABC transporter substrate-binding protein PstS [Streptomyces piniterrae]TJZ44564.1 phosphate ABC transporter substrate-binding protein PstS [Streptomyces piniterrae]
MKRQHTSGLHTLAAGSAIVSGVLILTACGSDNGSGQNVSTAKPTTSAGAGGIACGKSATLQGSGSTAQQYAMQLWIKNYTRACPGTKITYNATGSGSGQKDFLQGKTAFAGSDSPLNAEQITQSKSVCPGGGHAVHLPMVGGPIAITYNLPGVTRLILDAPSLAKIFNAQITMWNDPAIAKLNPGVKLPSMPIKASHRSDSSGTTDNFTSYLSEVAPSDWPYPHSKEWKAKGSATAEKSAGLADYVKQNRGAIGYVELTYALARRIPTVAIATGASSPVDANVLSSSKAISESKPTGSGEDLVLKLNYATKATGSYPINAVTYEIVCDKGNKPETWPATKAFLTFMASKKGQEELSFQGYATLPATVVNKVRSNVGKLS